MYDIRSAMLNIGIVFTPGKFKINLEKTWKTPGILVNLRSTDPVILIFIFCLSAGGGAPPPWHQSPSARPPWHQSGSSPRPVPPPPGPPPGYNLSAPPPPPPPN